MSQNDEKDIYMLQIVKKKEVLGRFLIEATAKDLAILKEVTVYAKIIATWEVLSAVHADREAYLETYITTFEDGAVPDIHKEYVVGDVIAILAERRIVREENLPKKWGKIVEKYKEDFYKKPPTVDESKMSGSETSSKAGEMDLEDSNIEERLKSVETTSKQVSEVCKLMDRLLNGMEKIYDTTTKVLSGIDAVHQRMDKVEMVQRSVEEKVKQSLSKQIPQTRVEGTEAKCSFCDMDNHSLQNCTIKTECIRCGKNNHPIQKCTYRGDLKCHYCKAEGHIAQLHQVENMDFRMKLLTEYGTSSFGHFIRHSKHPDQQRRPNPWTGTGKLHPIKRLGWKRRTD